MAEVTFKEPIEFNWDEGNQQKNFIKHRVTDKEAEEVFLNPKKQIFEDVKHLVQERRYLLFGQTVESRLLIVALTLRGDKVRIISARDMNKKEKKIYEEAIKNSKI